MRFWSFQDSLSDYPKEVCLLTYLSGCNLRCPYCYNYRIIKPLPPPPLMTNEYFLEMLERKKHFYGAVGFTGGEPTLDPELPMMLHCIKRVDFDIKTKIDTNGTNPDIIGDIMWDIDYIAMDVKSDRQGYKLLGADDEKFNNILRFIELLLMDDIDYEFRITAVYPFVNSVNIINIGKMLKGAKMVYIQNPRLDDVLDPSFPMSQTENLKYLADVLTSYVTEVFVR